jgi:hypothetical protein
MIDLQEAVRKLRADLEQALRRLRGLEKIQAAQPLTAEGYTAPGDILYLGDARSIENTLDPSGNKPIATGWSNETLMPGCDLTLLGDYASITITVAAWTSGWSQAEQYMRVRRDSLTGELLDTQYWNTYGSGGSQLGHQHEWAFIVVDNAPTTGHYVLTVEEVENDHTVYSDTRGFTLSGNSKYITALHIGTTGQVMTVAPTGLPVWAAAGFSGSNTGDVTLGAGSDAALSLSGQVLTLADVLTPTEHTAIGNSSPHHAPVTLTTDHGLSLTGQQLALGTPSTVTGSSTNAVTTTTHSHALDNDTTALTKYLKLTGGTLTGPVIMGGVTSAMQLTLDDTKSLFEVDTTYKAGFYVNAAGEPIFTMVRGSAGTTMLGAGVNGDTMRRFTIDVDGGMSWGSGAATRDVILLRSAANELRLYDSIQIDLDLRVGNTTQSGKVTVLQTGTADTSGVTLYAPAKARSSRWYIDASSQTHLIAGGGSGDIVFNAAGAGKIGIHTAAPTAGLEVVGKADNIQLLITANGTQTTDLARFGTASNYLAIEADGTIRLVGTATGWKDIFFPQSPPKATGAGNPTLGTLVGNLRAYSYAVNDLHDFDPQEYGHDGKTSATITYHAHWYSMTNVAAARAVKWEIEETWCNPSGVINATTTTAVEVTIPANTAAGTQFVSDVLAKTPSGIGPATMLHIRLKRVTAAGTAPAADPFVAGIHAHYEVDTPAGSRTISAK